MKRIIKKQTLKPYYENEHGKLYHGDCLEVIKILYTVENWPLRRIAKELGTNHHKIKNILQGMKIKIEKKPNTPMSEEHKKNISIATKGRESWTKGKKMPISSLYKNMATHLRFEIDPDWLSQFEDIEKLKFLNRCISHRGGRFDVDANWYKAYILKFYNDEIFNTIYSKWIGSGDKYLRPTIDHIKSRASGGENNIDNLQFLSWFENRSKNDMSQEDWDKIKKNIWEYLI